MNSSNVSYNKKISPQFGDQILQKLLPDSRDWLIGCLDPFHDYALESHGLPDERSAPSVVQVHNQVFTLTTPTVAAGGPWDASVIYTGFNSVINTPRFGGMMLVKSSTGRLYDSSSISSGTPFGALNIYAGAAGATMQTGAPHVVGTTNECLGSVLNTDRCRLLSVGVEIHNTTAEIYKQGSLTVAQLPDLACDSSNATYIDSSDNWKDFTFQSDRAMVQASTLAPLLTVPGSQTWPAAEGCYLIPRMTIVPREIAIYPGTISGVSAGEGGNSRVPVLYGTDGRTALPEPCGFTELTATGPIYVPNVYPRNPSGFAPCQIFLTGLSSQTSLTITFRTVVEYFPALGSPLLPLASPCSAFDPLAFELYSQIVKECPYAVPVNENSAGDYFRKVLAVVGRVMQHAGPGLGIALGNPALGTLLSVSGRMIAERTGLKQAGPKKRNQMN